jgi:hypothetical protein
MNEFPPAGLRTFLFIFIGLTLIGFVLAASLLAWVLWRVKRIQVPPGADFLTTLRYTPLSVVILLDLLDLAFDFLAAPFAWVLLGYLNLQALRAVTVIEALIPGTQFLPTMTAAWLLARFAGPELQRLFSQLQNRR